MIDTLYVKNLEDDATVYSARNGKNCTDYLHLFDDCHQIKNHDRVDAKEAVTQFDDTPICTRCMKRFTDETDKLWDDRGWGLV